MYYPDENIDVFQEDYEAQRDLYDDAGIYGGFAESDPFLDGHPGLLSQTKAAEDINAQFLNIQEPLHLLQDFMIKLLDREQ
ncbi:hypothetical protein FRC00_013558 [Tulasnella sp. 408]|nr:hypothetical protein FRC00_013558 [Tulasnella sp. 408]